MEKSLNLVEPPLECLEAPATVIQSPMMDAGYIVVGILVMFTILAFGLNKKLDNKQRKALLPLIVLIGSLFILPIAPVKADNDWGNPLSVTNVGLLAYYEHTSWTLANTTTAFQNYTDHGSYYDGYIRVWQDVTGNDYNGDDVYVDVRVRVRSDGWIMAWLDTTEYTPGNLLFWGKERSQGATKSIPVNATTCSRAIQNVFYVADETFPGYNEIYHYDYSTPTATKLVILEMHGWVHDDSTNKTYFIVPSSSISEIVQCYVVLGAYGVCHFYMGNSSDVFIVELGSLENGWFDYDVDTELKISMALDQKYYLKPYVEPSHASAHGCMAIVAWLR